MKQMPINENKIPTYNKRAVRSIILLVACGVITGIILSVLFVDEANYRIENFDDEFRRPSMGYPYDVESLTIDEILFPSFGVIVVCISVYLLVGLIITYIKIFLNTNSKYVVGLLFFLTPLLIQSIIFINALRNLYISSAIPFPQIQRSIGFGLEGLGGIIVIVSVFEIIGLTILLYLSSE